MGSINNALDEVSAAEMSTDSDLIWAIEDSGNNNTLYALKKNGKIEKSITVLNAENDDWEDLTMDKEGNIYIGDFGNNSKKRKTFNIYKVKHEDLNKSNATAEVIKVKLPEKFRDNFEAFFIYDDSFYLFSKESKKFVVLKVKNEIGIQESLVRSEYELNGNGNKITSADISDDGQIIVLLNHDKLWKLTNFNGDDFFSGTINAMPFGNNTQKEGVCFQSNDVVLITDERNGGEGGNIYSFSLR